MREDRRVHIDLVTQADYINYVSQALEVIESMVTRLQEEVQELQELLTDLADLASIDTFGQDIDRALAEPSVPPVPRATAASSAPTELHSLVVSSQLPVAQSVQQARWLSNREQLALARQRARDWAARELTRTNNRHHSA
jgi:conjugal transfer/entry exclusion protein